MTAPRLQMFLLVCCAVVAGSTAAYAQAIPEPAPEAAPTPPTPDASEEQAPEEDPADAATPPAKPSPELPSPELPSPALPSPAPTDPAPPSHATPSPTLPPPALPSPAPTDPVSSSPSSDDDQGADARIVFGAIALGIGGATMVAGSVLAIIAAVQYADLDCPRDACSPEEFEAGSDYNDLRIPSGVTIFVGGLVAFTGAVFLIHGATDDDTLVVGIGPSSITVGGKF